jgi:Hsp20/alpha crystallin family
MTVAGFSPAELNVTVQENTLLVTGKAQKEDENGNGYLHHGIARRSFERRFSLADHMKVTGASTTACLASKWFVKCPRQPSCGRSRSAPRLIPCTRR